MGEKKENKMAKEKTIAVIGLGRFGLEVCKGISEKGGKVIAVDISPKLIDKVKDFVVQAILIDVTDEETFSKLPLENLDVAVIAIGDNIEASIIATALFKKSNIPYIVARAVSELHEQILKQIGANEIINIEVDEGKRVANKLISPNILERITISKSLIFAEIVVPQSFVDKTLPQLDIRNKYKVNIISIRRFYQQIDDLGNPTRDDQVIMPTITEKLQVNDILAVVGGENDIEKLKEVK